MENHHYSCPVEAMDSFIANNNDKYAKNPLQIKKRLCMVCSSPASVKISHDVGSVIKIEYYCKICCGN